METHHWLLFIVAVLVSAWFLNTPEEKDSDRADFNRFILNPVMRLWRGLVRLLTGR